MLRAATLTIVLLTLGLIFIPALPMLGMNFDDGQMTGCIFMADETICSMNILTHLSAWQRQLTAISVIILLLALSFLTAFWINPPQKSPSVFRYYLNRPLLATFNYLRQALSQGLIHPKIF